jgi:large subunit ribosomal protein L32
MGALPKHKVSRHQRGNRRRHQVLSPPVLVVCPTCRTMMRAHRVCKECGYYKGRQVIETKKRQDDER